MRKIKTRCAAFALPVALGIGNVAMAAVCDYKVTNEWNDGFAVAVTILNDTTETIVGWSTSFEYTNASISQLWNGDLVGTNPFTVSNLGYNQNIAPNESVAFGFNASKDQPGSAAEIAVLGGICSGAVVNGAPIANGTVSSNVGTVPFDVIFDASLSTDPEGDVLSYFWDFGNGETATTPLVTKSFTTAGSYTATLVVSDGLLNSTEQTFTITANSSNPSDAILYLLDESASSLHFVSTKKTHLIESHTFGSLSGSITEQGLATLAIALDSVETNNVTRDGRMKSMLFETSLYSQALVTVDISALDVTSQNVGTTQTQTLVATLDLHGVAVLLNVDVWISKLSTSTLLVQNVAPILLSTDDFALTAGVEALREIANLSVISYAVPVNFNLIFSTTINQP